MAPSVARLARRTGCCLWMAVYLLGFLPGVLAEEGNKVSLRPLAEDEKISADSLRMKQEKKENFVLFDARNQEAYEVGHITGAVLPLPLDHYRQVALYKKKIIASMPDTEAALALAMRGYPKDTEVVTYCNVNCSASAHLLLSIQALGFEKVRAMEEGFQAWEAKGYPVTLRAPHLSLDEN